MINAIAAGNAFSLAAAVFALGTGPTHSVAASTGPRPNIVVFMTDDQALSDMRVMRKTQQALGARGVTFTNAFVSFPLCCPSRATYLSGRYAHNHGVLFNDPPYGYESARGTERLPGLLEDAGYRTIHIGKYFNGYGDEDPVEIPDGWSRFHGTVGASVHWYHGYTMNHNGTLKTYGDVSDPDPRTYLTDVMRRLAFEEIRTAGDDDVPFFLSLSFLAPHGENAFPGQVRSGDNPRAAPRHRELYRDARAPRDPSFNESAVGDKPSMIRGLAPLQAGGKGFIDKLHRARWRSLRAVDETVAKVVRRVEAAGLLDNTWFVFTSDNGFFAGHHRLRYGKYLAYEPSIRVPLIVAGPDAVGGATSEQLVSNVDLAPTILDLARVRVDPATIDGRSLLRFVRRPNDSFERVLLLESAPPPEAADEYRPLLEMLEARPGFSRPYQGVRTSRYKYIEYHDGQIELYDLLLDPSERQSLHDDPFHSGLLPLLRAALEMLRDCSGDACRVAEARTLGASLS